MIRTQTKNVKTVANVIMGGMPQFAWVNPSNAAVEDGNCAVATFSDVGVTDLLRGIMQGDNFTLPSTATPQKVKVRKKRDCSPSSVKDYEVRLVKASVFGGTNNADTVNDYPTTLAWKTYDPGNLWGLTLTYADVNADGFGCGLISQASAGSVVARVDVMEITVTYDDGLTDNSEYVSQVGPPSTMTVGQHALVSVTMKNTGASTWTYSPFPQPSWYLAPYDGVFLWTPSSIPLSVGDSIGLNQNKTFSFEIAAPATPGNYNFRWRMKTNPPDAYFGAESANLVITVNPAPVYRDGPIRFM